MFVEKDYYIGFRDVNSLQELTNTSLLANLENTSGIHSSKINNSINNENAWVLLAWKVRVLKRPFYGDTINVETWSRHMEKFYAFRDFKVYNNKKEVMVLAASKWAFIDLKKRKIVKIPEKLADSYQSEENSFAFEDLEDAKFGKLKEPDFYESSTEFKITRNMIDTNNHLHNIYYFDIAKEAIPEKLFENKEYNDFEIMYKKEIKCGQIVKALYTKLEKKHIVVIKNQEETDLHAIIMME